MYLARTDARFIRNQAKNLRLLINTLNVRAMSLAEMGALLQVPRAHSYRNILRIQGVIKIKSYAGEHPTYCLNYEDHLLSRFLIHLDNVDLVMNAQPQVIARHTDKRVVRDAAKAPSKTYMAIRTHRIGDDEPDDEPDTKRLNTKKIKPQHDELLSLFFRKK